jgi:Protein of unknown function (DUF5132)
MGLLKRNLPAGIAIGVAAGVAARELAPSMGNILRPVARTTVKSGVVVWEKLREVAANLGESFEDLNSEIHADLGGNGRSTAAPAISSKPKKKERDESRVG